MSYLIDTDLLSILERKRVPAKLVNWLEENGEQTFLSIVSLAEIEYGVENAPREHQKALREWFSGLRSEFQSATEDLTQAVLVRWKELLTDLKKKNRTMTCEDSLIAATALFHGHTIVTANTRHFEPAGVATINPLTL